MRVDRLSDKAVEEMYSDLLECLIGDATELDIDSKRELLETLVDCLDNQDCDDVHGPEGWKHRYGIED